MADISSWQAPLSLLLAAVFLTGAFLLWKCLPQGRLRRIIGGRWLCATAMTSFLILTAIEGTWGVPLHRSPIMWAVSMIIMVSLVFVIQDAIKNRTSISGILTHMGLFLVFFGALWGAPDVVDAQMSITAGFEEYDAISSDGRMVPMPFGIRLEEFVTDYYDDGTSPKQYGSIILVDGKQMRTSVNHPCRYGGYNIYQSGYDTENGRYSVLKLVHDSWYPLVLFGMILLAAGALLGLKRSWNSGYPLIAMAVVAVVFAFISLSRIRFGTLVPALRSVWFIPHIALYMLAYSALALSLIAGAAGYFNVGNGSLRQLCPRLLGTASSLLLLGMICGAVWAKSAWGDWWTWDAKECWAAVTWFFAVLGSHLPANLQKRWTAVFICILLSFLAMQMAWYGVEILPAAQTSLHAYR